MISFVDLVLTAVLLLGSCWAFVRMVEARGRWNKGAKPVPGPRWRFPWGDRFEFYLRPESVTREYSAKYGSIYRIFHWFKPMLFVSLPYLSIRCH